jgi:tRNA-2-methylthio-N6-dimethylallyladenosine synthase
MTPPGTFYIETMGCQMNALDSELVLSDLTAQGYRRTSESDAADIVILNTCSVRQHAEDKVYSRLGELGRPRQDAPERIVAVIGCMAERDGDGLLAKPQLVDVICGPNELHRLPSLIADVREGRQPVVALSGRLRGLSTPGVTEGRFADLEAMDAGRVLEPAEHATTPRNLGNRQAYVRITRGCNKHCSFCVVPHTRGPEVHRPPDRIVDEVKRLADNGVVEVTLLGQTVNHYHHGAGAGGGGTTFATLLRRVHDEVPGLPRLRFVTSFPRDFTDETLEVMASSPRICHYLHIPAQSGSDRVLARMNRGHTVEQYEALLDRARKAMPDVSIAGDMIVGFSGETEEDFDQSLELLRRARYKNCFVFKYSPRPGTPADRRLPDDVPEETKRRRNRDMLAVQAQINMANHKEMLGRRVEVLVEGPSKAAVKAKRSPHAPGSEAGASTSACNQLVGRTRQDGIIVFEGRADMVGRFLEVRIIGATPYTLHGEVINSGETCGGQRERIVPLTHLGS